MGETLVERFKNRILAAGSQIEGKSKKPAIDDLDVHTKLHQIVEEPVQAKGGKDILCESFCMKKYFEMQVRIKQEFRTHKAIFD